MAENEQFEKTSHNALAKELGRYALILILLPGLVSASDIATDACRDLTVENGSYVLTQDVSSDGTCFTVKANGITVDGGGHTLEYAKSSTGYALYNPDGYDNVTVKNFVIVKTTSDTPSAQAIFFTVMANGTITNNTITLSMEDTC